jgi:hypothetical protein
LRTLCGHHHFRVSREGADGWVKQRVTDDGDKRFVARYRNPKAGNAPPAPTPPAALPNAPPTARKPSPRRLLARHSRSQVTFTEYVETVWLPSKHVEQRLDKWAVPS